MYSYNDEDFIWIGSVDPNWVGWQHRTFPIEFTNPPFAAVGVKNDRNPTGTRFGLHAISNLTKKSFSAYFFSAVGDLIDVENIYTEHYTSVIVIGQ